MTDNKIAKEKGGLEGLVFPASHVTPVVITVEYHELVVGVFVLQQQCI